jgi:hypothetical protein
MFWASVISLTDCDRDYAPGFRPKMADEGVERIEEMCEKNVGKHRLRPTIDGDGDTQHHRRNGVQFELLAEHSPQQKPPVCSKLILQPAHCLSGLALVGTQLRARKISIDRLPPTGSLEPGLRGLPVPVGRPVQLASLEHPADRIIGPHQCLNPWSSSTHAGCLAGALGVSLLERPRSAVVFRLSGWFREGAHAGTRRKIPSAPGQLQG